MNPYIEQFKDDFENALNFLKEKFSGLRTGRASAELVEDIMMLADHIKSFSEYIQFLGTKYLIFD